MRRLWMPMLLSAILFAMPCHVMADESSPIGQRVENFRLQNFRGEWHELGERQNERVVVLAFLGTECPLARLYAARLLELNDEFGAQGVAFLGILSNQQDTASDVAAYAGEYQIDFPLLMDVGNQLADRIGAKRTPEVFVLDEDRVVRYRGRIDDQFGVGYQRSKVVRRDLAIALEELLAGKTVTMELTDPPGCLIGREVSSDADSDVTWSNQISRIFQKRCQGCHREGEIGPFSLMTHEETQGWGPMIREVVEQRRMPPWHADPAYGRFSNEARLTEEEQDLIFRWVAAGTPEGNPADLPPPREFSSGWQIEPDEVYYMREEPFDVPAEGIVEYQRFMVDPGFTEDVWIKGVEVRPGNSAVVHHATIYYLPPGQPFSLALNADINFLGTFVPGIRSFAAPEGMAYHLPAGTNLCFEMHYTPNGVPQSDRTCIGLKFADPEDVRRVIKCVQVANLDFEIPPGAPDHVVEKSFDFDEDSYILSYFPHMHLRGKSFRFEAIYPDGQRETLLDVPHYDFNWQHKYCLEKPKRVPRGTRVQCIARFDNSANNPVNPDATTPVVWGDQTEDEMMIGGIFWTTVADRSVAPDPPKNDHAMLWASVTGGTVAIALSLLAIVLRRPRRAPDETAVQVGLSETFAAHDEKTVDSAGGQETKTRGAVSFRRALLGLAALCLLPILLLIDTSIAVASGWSTTTDPLAMAVTAASALVLLAGVMSLAIRSVRRVLAQKAGKCALLSSALLIGWSLAEFGIEVLVPMATFHARKPNSVYRFNPDPVKLPGVSFPSKYATNSSGHRGGEWNPQDDSVRLLCIGGGSVEGLYLDDDKAWTNVLGRKLTEAGSGQTPTTVAAAAVSNYASGHHRRFIETSPVVDEADCVIVQLGATDLVRFLSGRDAGESWPPLWYRTHATSLLREMWNVRLGFGPVVDSTGKRFVGEIRNAFKMPKPDKPLDFDRAMEDYAERVRAIYQAAQRRGVQRLVFTTQPVLWKITPGFEESRLFWVGRVFPARRGWDFTAAKNLRPLIDRYNETLRATCAELGVECIDLDTMNGQRQFFYDDYHVNDAGAQEMASLVAAWFREHPLAN